MVAAPARAETELADVGFTLAELSLEGLSSEDLARGDLTREELAIEELAPNFGLADATDPSADEIAPRLYTDADIGIGSDPNGRHPQNFATTDNQTQLSFGQHVAAIRTELLLAFGHQTAINLLKFVKRGGVSNFSFKDEGWFGTDTVSVGVDKSVHAHNTYYLAELLGARIRRNTNTTRGTAMSGALLASGLMFYSEIYDGFKGGFGFNDLVANSVGAGFSVLRYNSPGLAEKLDFRFLLIPNRNIYSPTGKEHYRQLRHLLALKLSGFEGVRSTPLRFVELHAGYYATGFTNREQERGDRVRRRPFVGVGVNLNELFFRGNPRTRAARAASSVLNYWQPPYTYVHAK